MPSVHRTRGRLSRAEQGPLCCHSSLGRGDRAGSMLAKGNADQKCFDKGAWGVVWGFRNRGKFLPPVVLQHAAARRSGLPESGGPRVLGWAVFLGSLGRLACH